MTAHARDYGQHSDEDALQVFGKKCLVLEKKFKNMKCKLRKAQKNLVN